MSGTARFELTVELHEKDFLADGGKALDETIEADESVSRRFAYALKWVRPFPMIADRCGRAFADCEQKVIDIIRSKL